MEPRLSFPSVRFMSSRLLRSQSDERLVELTRAGHAEAFEAIVGRYRRPLLRYCERLLPASQAEDAVQDVLTRAHAALERTEGEMHLRAWLYRIAHNASISVLRQHVATLEPLTEDLDGVEPPDQAFERSQDFRELIASVQALPEQQRNAITLRELEGRSYEEISTALGVSEGAVQQLVHRARTKLRASAAAVMPPAFAIRLPWSGSPEAAARAAELGTAGGGFGAAALVNVCAAAVVAGAIVSGVTGGGSAPGDGSRSGPVAGGGADRPSGRAGTERKPSVGPLADRSSGDGGGSDARADGSGAGGRGDGAASGGESSGAARSGDAAGSDGSRASSGSGGSSAGGGGSSGSGEQHEADDDFDEAEDEDYDPGEDDLEQHDEDDFEQDEDDFEQDDDDFEEDDEDDFEQDDEDDFASSGGGSSGSSGSGSSSSGSRSDSGSDSG